MANKNNKKYSKEFGKKEKVLNYACSTYQLSRPNKVGSVMELIRKCQPNTIEQWEKWYFENAYTENDNKFKITKESIYELGDRLYAKITEVVLPDWQEAFNSLTLDDCREYIYNLTINRTFDGFLTEKSVVYDELAKKFTEVSFEESLSDLDHAGDIDYLGYVSESKHIAFGIQIKPITAQSNFGNYSVSERMKANFDNFKEKYKGNVFIVYSVKRNIANIEIIENIRIEIERLTNDYPQN